MRILASTDHHTLHPTTPTHHILGNLSTFMYKDNNLDDVSLVLFIGDMFDRLVESPNPDLFKVKEWFKTFSERCNKAAKKPPCIYLEGTFYHEWGQPRHLTTVIPEGYDFRYVDTIKVERFPALDNLTVLCIPDNLGAMTPKEIWEAALNVLKNEKLDRVDILLFHQAFHSQLPSKMRDVTHDPIQWESICEFLILQGHIHTPSIDKFVDRLYGYRCCVGSFDRISHGEEHPKGALIIDLDKEKKRVDLRFWENKRALPYVTMKVSEEITPEQLIKDLHEFIRVKQLPHFAQVRLKGGLDDVVKPILSVFEREYPHLGFKAKGLKSEEEMVESELFSCDDEKYKGRTITRENIAKDLAKEAAADFEKLGIPMDEALKVFEDFR